MVVSEEKSCQYARHSLWCVRAVEKIVELDDVVNRKYTTLCRGPVAERKQNWASEVKAEQTRMTEQTDMLANS